MHKLQLCMNCSVIKNNQVSVHYDDDYENLLQYEF